MDDLMRVVVVKPGEPGVAMDVDGSLEGLQRLVEGMIQVVYPFKDNAGIICNDEGKILGMPLNRALRGETGDLYDVIAGTFAVVGLSEDNFQSLTPEQEARYVEMYKVPELFEKKDGKVIAVPVSGNMTLEGFRGALIEHMQELLARDGIDAVVEPCEVEKIQAGYIGISVQEKGKPVGISLDVSPAYELYKGAGMEASVESVYASVKEGLRKKPDISITQIGDYSWIMKRISAEVINRDRNAELLKKIPHTDVADLAVIYRVHLFDRHDGAATAVVTDDMLRVWKVSEAQFKADALAAAERNYPLQMCTMSNIIGSLGGQDMAVPDATTMLVCMAEGMDGYGAGVIAYPDFQERARNTMGGDFFILPSSRHEVILVPAGCAEAKELEAMVQSINASDVLSKEDFLSDHVYRFDGKTKALTLAATTNTAARGPIDIEPKRRGR